VWVCVQCTPLFRLISGAGFTLATITFKATYANTASCTLHFINTKLLDFNGNPISCQVVDGNYKFVKLSITIATNKINYQPGQNVTVHGNLTSAIDGLPSQGLVALEVDDPENPIVVRTLQTGSTPPPGNITILVTPCTQWGIPQQSFPRGELAYFNVTITNTGATAIQNIVLTANAYDNATAPFGAVESNIPILLGNTTSSAEFSVWIPDWTTLGYGRVYANAFTGLPRNGGIPYCPEKSAQFNITGTGTAGRATAPSTTGINGKYSLTFKLLINATRIGVYRAYAAAFSLTRSFMNYTEFGVNALTVPNPYPTIQQAVNAANSTINSILVLPGTYNEHVILNKNVTLVGSNPSNTIIDGGGKGTVVNVTSCNVEISGFTIRNGGKGINLKNSSYSIISENTITMNGNGIYLNNSSQRNTIQGNTITSNNGYGINIQSSNYNNIASNVLSNNTCGIYLNNSTGSKLRNNSMAGNKYNFGVFGHSIPDFTHDIDTSNTVDGKPIIYWVKQQNMEVPYNAGFIAIVNSTNIAVRGLNLKKNGEGILLAFTNNSLIERVSITGNGYGIYLVNSFRNTIISSGISNNTVGIYQRYCNGSIICHNNFINNTNQVNVSQSSNTWDDSAGKGNYWSDYLTRYPTATEIDNTGVWNTPYIINVINKDRYPLMNPYIPVHDIALTNVTTIIPHHSSHVYPGWTIPINVTARNKGDFTETFNVTAHCGNTTTYTETVNLRPLANTTITFDWDTIGVAKGNYTIKVQVALAPGETNTGNNTYTGGWVLVAKMGDVNGDGVVNVADVILVLIHFGTVPPQPPECDVNGDGVVNAADVILVLIHFG
jgi:parallel beta-helix repeat protein